MLCQKVEEDWGEQHHPESRTTVTGLKNVQQDDPMGLSELHVAGTEMGQKRERHLL